MPPDATMIAPTSFYPAASTLRGDRWEDEKKSSNGSSAMMNHGAGDDVYFQQGSAVRSSLNKYHTDKTNGANGGGNDGDWSVTDQTPAATMSAHGMHPDDRGESHQSTGSPHAEPLHKAPCEEFHEALDSLREATKEALHLSCREQERLCIEGEELEARIAYMRKKVKLAREELLEKGSLGEGMEEELRLSLVKEGDDELSSSGLLTIDSSVQSPGNAEPDPAIRRINSSQGALHASLASKRSSTGKSSLHGSQTTQASKGGSLSDASAMPHMSRSSLLGMLGASKNWLDNYTGGGSFNESNEGARDSVATFRPSFLEGAGDGMPSRWRAREQEREKTAKEKDEEEEKRLRAKASGNKGATDNSELRPAGGKSKGEKLQDLIAKREREISSLEGRVSSVEQQTTPLRDAIFELREDQQQAHADFEAERTKLLNEIDQVQHDNERLDHMLVETGVSLEEKKITVEILANELKGAREELADVQNEMDRRRRERRRKAKSRTWSWMRNSASSLLGGVSDGDDGGEEEDERQQQHINQPQHHQQLQPYPSHQGQEGSFQRYQIPADALQHYRTLTHGHTSSSDEDTSNYTSDDNYRSMDRRRSHASVGTAMSGLTLDSCELVDILEQLELDST